MNILFGRIQSELPSLIEGFHFLQPLEDLLPISSRKNALAAKHEHVSPAAPDIVRDEPLVTRRDPFHISSRKKIDRLPGRKLLESSAPEFFNFHLQSPKADEKYLSVPPKAGFRCSRERDFARLNLHLPAEASVQAGTFLISL
jgi:hypothetical protein